MLQRRKHDWMYFAEPEATMDGRPVECARGKVIGGSSSINAMAYVRGHRGDYDRWAARGADRMVLRACAALFPPPGVLGRRRERLSRRRRAADDAVDALPRPARRCLSGGCANDAGHPITEDYNGAQQEGFGRSQHDDPRRAPLQRRGRLSAAGDGRPNLERRDERAGDEDPVRGPPRRRGRVSERRTSPASRTGRARSRSWPAASSTRRSC